MKPYPAYKDSGIEWIGKIPEHWGIKKLNYLAFLKSGESITAEQFDDNGPYPVFGGNGLRGYFSNYTHNGEYVLIGRQGALCGNVNYSNGKFWASEHAIVVTPLTKLKTHWLGELLRTMNLNQYSISAAQPGLSVATISALKIPVPPFSEQQLIANLLNHKTSQIDTLIEKKQKQIELLKEERTAIINQTVTKGLNPDVPMKDSGIEWLGEVPEHWIVNKLGFLTSVKARLGWKGLKASEYVDEGYIFLSTPNIKSKEIDFENVNYISAERYYESPEIMLEEGDVLIAKDGSTLGITNVVKTLPSHATVNSSIAVIRPNNKLNSVFLYYFLSSNYTQNVIQLFKGGMGVPHLFQADLRKFVILLPPENEQKLIADFLDGKDKEIENLIEIIQKQITHLQEYHTALISNAVTGKIDVRDTPTAILE